MQPLLLAQTAESLMEALVKKGVLTEQEAEDIKSDLSKENKQYNKVSVMGKFVSNAALYGDVRARFESFQLPPMDRNRFRYRLRAGLTYTLTDDFEVGFRLSSSDPASGGVSGGDPISGNTTFQDNGSKKFVYLDLAYGKWSPHFGNLTNAVTVGKMENPFVFSDMVFDHDYTPEGLANVATYGINDQHVLRLAAAAFVVDEVKLSSNDPMVYGAQLRWDAAWTQPNKYPGISTTLGVAALNLSGAANLASAGSTNNILKTSVATWQVPNQNAGNTYMVLPGNAVGLAYRYNPFVVDGAVTFTLAKMPGYGAAFPIRVAGEYMQNPAAPSDNEAYSVGVTFGKAGKKHLWEVGYRYKELQADAWYEELVDSDFGAYYTGNSAQSPGGGADYKAGTNIRGHIIKAGYSPFDSVTFNVTYFLAETIRGVAPGGDGMTGRLQVDANWKF